MSHERSTGWDGGAESLGWEYQTKPQPNPKSGRKQEPPASVYNPRTEEFSVPDLDVPKMSKHRPTITETSQALAKLKAEQADLEATRKKLDAEQANLQTRHKTLAARRDQLQSSFGTGLFAGIRAITGSGPVNQLLADSEKFESDYAAYRENANRNRMALMAKKLEVVEMEVSLSTLEGKPILAKARHDLEAITAEAEKLRAELEKVSAEREEYKKQTESIPRLERQIDRLQKDRVEAVLKTQEVQKQLDAANARIRFLEKQLKDAGVAPIKQSAGVLRR